MRAAISILRAAQIFLCSLSAFNKAAFFCSTICYLHIFVFLGFVSRVGAVASYRYFFGKCHGCMECMAYFSLFSEAHAVTFIDRTAFTQGPLFEFAHSLIARCAVLNSV